jgi:hypothetical protein
VEHYRLGCSRNYIRQYQPGQQRIVASKAHLRGQFDTYPDDDPEENTTLTTRHYFAEQGDTTVRIDEANNAGSAARRPVPSSTRAPVRW